MSPFKYIDRQKKGVLIPEPPPPFLGPPLVCRVVSTDYSTYVPVNDRQQKTV